MAQLSNKIKLYLDREVDFDKEVLLYDNGDGVVYIKEWNATDKPKPTDEQLNALESQADDIETANQVISNRKAEYPSIEDCVHAILDDDLENLQILRQAVKEKYPK
jgi:hypothetical protein